MISVVVPAWNAAADIGVCVAPILASRGVALEVVVADDGSTDGTAEAAARLPCRLLRLEHPAPPQRATPGPPRPAAR